MAAIELDTRGWPVVVTRPLPGLLRDSELETYLAHFRAEIRVRPGAYVSVVDLLQAPMLTATQRRILASGMGSDEDSHRRCIGAALIFESALLRRLLTAIFWLRAPKHEVQIFATKPQAWGWAREVLERARAEGAQ